MKKLPHPAQPEGPVSVRMSSELQKQLDVCAQKTGMKVTDLMRLCLRIGIEHFSRIDYNTAKCIVDAVEKTKAQGPMSIEDQSCADTAPSIGSTPASPPINPTPVNIVKLPPPPVLATLMHDSLMAAETPISPPVETPRQEVIYPKKNPRKSS